MIKQIKNSYCCVGLMSGTSLDGLDIVLCELERQGDDWSYALLKQQTVAYTDSWRARLQDAPGLSGRALLLLHREYGEWMAREVNTFLVDVPQQPDLIASHGHTVFHEPDKEFNFQLGDGNVLAAQTGITAIADFRSLDVCLNGQGAPLVPIGDELLFANYRACVNIGGFVNVSCRVGGERIAWDICPANFVTNRLVQPMGLSMDANGAMGAKGVVVPALQQELDALDYYQQTAPKSLSQEWVEQYVWPVIDKYEKCDVNDILRTYYEHITDVMAKNLNKHVPSGSILFTGGGVYNTFLMDLIKAKVKAEVIVPVANLVDYKEALVFAFLGLLRYRGEVNCLKSVTGASRDSSSGVICG